MHTASTSKCHPKRETTTRKIDDEYVGQKKQSKGSWIRLPRRDYISVERRVCRSSDFVGPHGQGESTLDTVNERGKGVRVSTIAGMDEDGKYGKLMINSVKNYESLSICCLAS